MTEGPSFEPPTRPDPKFTEPPVGRKSLLYYSSDQVTHAMAELTSGDQGAAVYDQTDSRLRNVFEAAFSPLRPKPSPRQFMIDQGGFFKLAYGYLHSTHTLLKYPGNLTDVFDTLENGGSRQYHPSDSEIQRYYGDDLGTNDAHTLIRTLATLPEGVRSIDEIRRLSENPNKDDPQVLRARDFMRRTNRTEQNIQALRADKLNLASQTRAQGYENMQKAVSTYISAGGSSELMRNTLINAESTLLNQLESSDLSKARETNGEIAEDPPSLFDYSPEQVKKIVTDVLESGEISQYLETVEPKVLDFVRNTIKVYDREHFMGYTGWRAGPITLSYDFLRLMQTDIPNIRSLRELFQSDGIDRQLRLAQGNDQVEEARPPVFDGSSLMMQPTMFALAMPRNMTPAAVTDRNALRKLPGKDPASMDRKESYRKLIDSYNAKQATGRPSVSAPLNLLVKQRGEMMRVLAESVGNGLTSELLGGELIRAEDWLLDKLLKSKQETNPIITSHPTDTIELGEQPQAREFGPNVPARMEGYREILKYFKDRGFVARFSQGTFVPAQEHGISLSEEKHSRPDTQGKEGAEPIDTRTFDIAQISSPAGTDGFEIDHPPGKGACYVVHPGIVKFWRSVYGEEVNFADIVDRQSRRTMRILGAHAEDHKDVKGISWQQRVIDFLDKREGYDVLDVMLASWFDKPKDGSPYLEFQNGGLVANTVPRHSEMKEWDEKIPDTVLPAINAWINKPETGEVKTALENNDFMKAAKLISGTQTGRSE